LGSSRGWIRAMTARWLGERWWLERRERGCILVGWAFRPILLLAGEEVLVLRLGVLGKSGVVDSAMSMVGSSFVAV
jgi:hypothetical protein